MKISDAERQAIKTVLEHGATFGYGNLIAHLQTGWARLLIAKYGMGEHAARRASGGPGYPFAMQQDCLVCGEWDETGARYADPKRDFEARFVRLPSARKAAKKR